MPHTWRVLKGKGGLDAGQAWQAGYQAECDLALRTRTQAQEQAVPSISPQEQETAELACM